MPERQRRTIFSADPRIAITPAADGAAVTLTGYALVWNVLSSDRGGFKVRLSPGSAKFAAPTLALWHHDFRHVLGSTDNNTLRLTPDDIGVKVEIDVPNTSAGRDVAELVRRGDVKGMSFAWVDDPKSSSKSEDGQTVLTVSSFLMDEVTVTAVPAFVETSIGVMQPAPLPAYARATHRRQLDRFKFELCRLPG